MLPWTHPSPKTKRHLDRFSRFCTAHGRGSLFFTTGRPFPSPLKLCLPIRRSGPPSNTWFFGPIRVHNPNGISIGSAVLHGSLLRQTDRPTDNATRAVTINNTSTYDYNAMLFYRIHLSTSDMPYSHKVDKQYRQRMVVDITTTYMYTQIADDLIELLTLFQR